MATTNNLGITLIDSQQAQQDVVMNEGLVRLDAKLTANIDIEMVDGANSIDADTLRAAMFVTLTAGSPAPSSGITVELANVACPLIVHNQCGEDVTINVDGDAVTAVVAANSTALLYSDGTTLALVASYSGGGVTTFLDLSDTPANYSGAAQRFARVNAGGSGIEFSAGELVVINETATFTLDASHAGAMVVCTSGSSLGVIVPDYASEPFPVGTQILIVQGGDGQVTISPDTGVNVYSPETLQLEKQFSRAALVCIAANEWLLSYDLEFTIPPLSDAPSNGNEYVRKDGAWAVASGGGGGGSGAWAITFRPYDNEPPAANFATLDVRNSRPALDFDATTQEAAVFSGVMPNGYAGGGVTVTLYVAMSTATSGTVGFDLAFERTDSSLDIDSDSFATAQTVTAVTVPGTAGQTLAISVNVSDGANMDGIVAGDLFRLRVRRDVANDDAAGDAELLAVHIREQ